MKLKMLCSSRQEVALGDGTTQWEIKFYSKDDHNQLNKDFYCGQFTFYTRNADLAVNYVPGKTYALDLDAVPFYLN